MHSSCREPPPCVQALLVEVLAASFLAKPALTANAVVALASAAFLRPADPVVDTHLVCYSWGPEVTCISALSVVVRHCKHVGSFLIP
jgi:hypothetical protein